MSHLPDAGSLIWPGPPSWHRPLAGGREDGAGEQPGAETGHTRRGVRHRLFGLLERQARDRSDAHPKRGAETIQLSLPAYERNPPLAPLTG